MYCLILLLFFFQYLTNAENLISSCCFSEHHLKQIELEHINLEGYELGAAYCRKSVLEGGFASLFLKNTIIHFTLIIGL
jgi:hypothetical protein